MPHGRQRASFDQISEFDHGKIAVYRDFGLSFRENGGLRWSRNELYGRCSSVSHRNCCNVVFTALAVWGIVMQVNNAIGQRAWALRLDCSSKVLLSGMITLGIDGGSPFLDTKWAIWVKKEVHHQNWPRDSRSNALSTTANAPKIVKGILHNNLSDLSHRPLSFLRMVSTVASDPVSCRIVDKSASEVVSTDRTTT
ncbi:hypothetical protein TNCV_2597841 [Trichonephila clavipes]|nr:hypothetical protein TNCV_2597841 [Trichonephila clavipes]